MDADKELPKATPADESEAWGLDWYFSRHIRACIDRKIREETAKVERLITGRISHS